MPAKKPTKKSSRKTSKSKSVALDVSLIVGSKVKSRLSDAGFRTAGDFGDALNQEVDGILSRARARAESNGRQTVKATDL